jgi:hypothetical protein
LEGSDRGIIKVLSRNLPRPLRNTAKTNTSDRTIGVSGEIGIEDLPNRNLKRYLYTNLFHMGSV